MLNQSINGTWQVAAGLIVLVPILTVLLGEVVDRLRRNDSAYVRFFSYLRTVILPMLVMFFLAKYVFLLDSEHSETEDYDRLHLVYQLVLSILYLTGAYAVYLLIAATKRQKHPDAWENRIPGLFKAVASALVFVVPVLLLLQTWNIEVGDFAKIVGIAGLAIGLALQDALSSITKGFLLVIDKPFAVGDWIEVNGVKGKVLDISWRSTRLLVKDYDIVVIPNLIISDNSVYNYTAMNLCYWDEFSVGFSYEDSPSKVKDILVKVLHDCPDLLLDPPPRIHTSSYDDYSIGYSVHYCIREYVDPLDQLRVRDSIMSRIWYAAERGGISIPFPISVEGSPETFLPDKVGIKRGIVKFLSENRYFSCLDEQTHIQLSGFATLTTFAKGETLFHEGDIATSVSLVRRGELVLSCTGDSLASQQHTLREHDLLCEAALVGRANRLTAVATTDVSIVSLPVNQFNPVLEENPDLEQMLYQLVSARMSAAEDLESETDWKKAS